MQTAMLVELDGPWVLSYGSQGTIIVGLLRDKKALIRLQTLQFIFDRLQGKKKDVSLSGGFVHAPCPRSFLAALPQEALLDSASAYDKILVKHRPEDASQDVPQNQIESNTAIEAARTPTR